MSDNKKKNLLKLEAAANPNPNAKPEDPATDPAAAAARANAQDASSAAKNAATDKKAGALAQFSDDTISKDFNGKIESVRGPPGAPIGYGVHKLSVEGGNPYAAKKTVEEPVNGIQHQPVQGPPPSDTPAAPAPKLSKEMQYRTDVG